VPLVVDASTFGRRARGGVGCVGPLVRPVCGLVGRASTAELLGVAGADRVRGGVLP
jgi:hypothetical protein